MNNPDVLRQIAMLLDFDSLVKLGRDTEYTLGVSKLFRDPMFWKQKTESLANRRLDNHPEVNWIGTYQIVEKFLKDIEQEKARIATLVASRQLPGWEVDRRTATIVSPIYRQGLVDVATLSILFDIHPPYKLRGDPNTLHQIRIKNLDVFLWLLHGDYIDGGHDILSVLSSTPYTDAVDIARYIVSRVEVPDSTIRELMTDCIKARSLNLLLFLLERFPNSIKHYKLLAEIMRYNNLPMLQIMLIKYIDELTKADLQATISYLKNFPSIPRAMEMSQLVVNRLNMLES